MLSDNTITEVKDNTVYQILLDDITRYELLYINTLNNPEDIYKTMTFNGLLLYISQHVFKLSIPTENNKNCIIDYNNISHLYITWNLYKYICCKYNKVYSVLGYTVFMGITEDTIYEWKRRNDNHSQFISSIKKDSETALQDKTANDSSIGSMFLLKAKYGYSETPQTVIIDTAAALNKPDSIADKYGSMPDLPEKPV